MTVPFGAMDRIGILRSLFPSPIVAQPDATRVERKLDPLEQAQKEMLANGITNDQRQGYVPRISEALAFHVDPHDYSWHGRELKAAILHVLSGAPIPDMTPDAGQELGFKTPWNGRVNRNDAWRLYLGLPQQNGTLEVSPFKPSKSTEDKVYLRVRNFWRDNFIKEGETSGALPAAIKELKKRPDQKMIQVDESGVMGHYTLSLGKDERGNYISYYDKWDLTPLRENKLIQKGAATLGKPFESYDRLYYDPKTLTPIPETRLQSGPTLEEVLNAKRRK